MESTISALRPMRLGEILDQAIRLYRRNFVTFIGIIALIHIPVTLISVGISYISQLSLQSAAINTDPSNPFSIFGTPGFLTSIGGNMIMGFVQLILVQGVAAGALTRAVTDSYLGQSTGIQEAYQRIGKSWGRLVLTLLLMSVILIGLTIPTIIVPCVGWLIGPGLIIFISWSVNALIAPTVVIEKLSVTASLRRAWDLARRRFWWLLGFIFILTLFAQLVVAGPIYVLNWIIQTTISPQTGIDQTILTVVATGLVGITFTLLYLPLQLTAHVLVYFDLRVRTEGFDLALLSMQTSGEQPNVDTILELPNQPPSSRLLEWSEVGYFAILTIGIVVLYVLIVTVLTSLMLAIFATAGGF